MFDALWETAHSSRADADYMHRHVCFKKLLEMLNTGKIYWKSTIWSCVFLVVVGISGYGMAVLTVCLSSCCVISAICGLSHGLSGPAATATVPGLALAFLLPLARFYFVPLF